MKYAVLPLLVSGLFLTACNEESKTEKTTTTVVTPAPEGCLAASTFTHNGVTYSLAEIDTNHNGCIEQAEIDALPTPEPEPEPEPVDTSAMEVESSNIQTKDATYAVITSIKLTGTSDFVTASGIDGIEDGTPIAQLDTINGGAFTFNVTATHATPRPSGARLLMFFSDKTADFMLNEGGSIGAGLQNLGTSNIAVNCTYDGTHTNMVCSGLVLDNSDKFTEIPVIGHLVILSCAGVGSTTCKNGGDLLVQFN
jgi:hypothetical protein